MAGDATVKQEMPVKMDVDGEDTDMSSIPAAAGAGGTEDDIYEDAGDLEFYNTTQLNSAAANMYLVRVPPYVWEAWDKMDDDTEIQVATLRQWTETDKNGESKYRMRMLLRNDIASHQSIPKEYELDLPMLEQKTGANQNTQIKNTFVFSEQDLPGFKAKNKRRAAAAAAGIPAHLLRQKQPDRVDKPAYNHWQHGRRQPRQEYFRKAIPSRFLKSFLICV